MVNPINEDCGIPDSCNADCENCSLFEEPETLTIFRKWNDGDIIALFPEIEWDHRGSVSSYMRVGQHGGATYHHVINSTKLATPDEYKDLKEELESIGYKLKIRKKWIRK